MELFYKAIETPFVYPFTISNGRTKTQQSAVIVGLKLGPNIGWGEAPAISYYDITTEQMLADLETYKVAIGKFAMTDPERYWHFLHHLLPNNPFLVCALDMAGWDLWGNMNRKPLYKLWNTEWTNIPLTDYTIGLDSIDNMIQKLEENPWPIYKVKLGSDQDQEIINAIRSVTDKPLRIDANGGWDVAKSLDMLSFLKDKNIQFIEQPLAKDDLGNMEKLFAESTIPLIADESCVKESDVEKCVGRFHGINIKLTKCSGITPARRMIADARQKGLKVMMGCMNETTVGSAAIAQFLPQLDFVDMDGPILLKTDIAMGVTIEQGVVSQMQGAGLGIRVTNL